MKWLWWLVPPTRGGCLVIPFVLVAGLAVVVVVSQLVQAVT